MQHIEVREDRLGGYTSIMVSYERGVEIALGIFPGISSFHTHFRPETARSLAHALLAAADALESPQPTESPE